MIFKIHQQNSVCLFKESAPVYGIYQKNCENVPLLFLPEEEPFSATQEEPVTPG